MLLFIKKSQNGRIWIEDISQKSTRTQILYRNWKYTNTPQEVYEYMQNCRPRINIAQLVKQLYSFYLQQL